MKTKKPAEKSVAKQTTKVNAKKAKNTVSKAKTLKEDSSINTKENNLKKLKKTKVIDNFVKKNQGSWTHKLWEEFCKNIQMQGFYPIDFDEVGLLLEDKKTQYFMDN